jgi:hypothetical protein
MARKSMNNDQPKPASLIRAELARIVQGWEAADQLALKVGTLGQQSDREAAEQARLDAAGQFLAFESELADLLLLFFRLAIKHQREALSAYLAELLSPELDPIIEAVLRMEGKR